MATGRELEKIFTGRRLEKVPMTHPIFHTVHDIKKLTSHEKPAKLEGITVGGKIVLIYSADGLNDARSMHGCCCCGGSELTNSDKVNANILAYALLQ